MAASGDPYSVAALRELWVPRRARGEFEADLDGVHVQGVDILRWNAQGKLVSFTVMVRPLRGLQKLVELMAAQLAAGQA